MSDIPSTQAAKSDESTGAEIAFKATDGPMNKKIPYLVPDIPPYFVQRRELLAIKELLLKRPAASLAPLTLYGPSGAGKSATAIALAHDADILNAFPDGVLWFSLGKNGDTIQQAQALWGNALGQEIQHIPDINSRAAALRTMLRESRALLIIDDVTSLEQIRALNVGGPNCVRLITTDRGEEITYGFKTRRHAIGRLTEPEALNLLMEWAGMLPEIYLDTVREIIIRLAYSPLALSLVGAQARQGITWLRLLEVLRDDQGPIVTLDPEDESMRDHALGLVINLVLSRFGNAQLQRASALSAFAAGTGSPFSVDATAACWDVGRDEAAAMLNTLIEASIVQKLPNATYALHTAIADHLRRTARPGIIEDAGKRVRSYYISLLEQGRDLYSLVDAQLNQVMKTYRDLRETNQHSAAVFADALLAYFEHRHLWVNLIHTAEGVIEISRLAGDTERELSTLSDLGFARSVVGNQEEALDAYEHTLIISRNLGDPLREATALNNLGAICERQGKYGEALDYYRQSLDIQQKLGIRENIAEALNNVAGVLYWNERWDDAIKAFQRALDMYDQLNDRHGQGQTWLNIGAVHERMGRDDEAEQAYQRSLAIYTNLGDLAGQAQALNNLGIVFFNLGDTDRALDNFKRSLAIKDKLGDRLAVASTLNNIALLYEKTGSLALALEHYEQSYTIYNGLDDQRASLVQENIDTLRTQIR